MPKRDPAFGKFGANIRVRREALKLSQEALAEQADLDRTYIGGIERVVPRGITGSHPLSPDCAPRREFGYSQYLSKIRRGTMG